MKKSILVLATLMVIVLMMSMGTGVSLAQNATATPSGSSDFNSSVTIFAVICENQAVVNLNGTMEAGYDVYYQVFSGAQGGGTSLTNLRQVQVRYVCI